MANEYASVDELKARLGITGNDLNGPLGIVLEGASRAIDNYCNRRFYLDGTATARIYQPFTSSRYLSIDDVGSLTDFAVASDPDRDNTFTQAWARDDQTDSHGYYLEPLNALVIGEGKPFEYMTAHCRTWPGPVKVTARWGWPKVPTDIKEATLVQASAAWMTPSQFQAGGTAESIHLDGSDTVTFGSINATTMAGQVLNTTVKELLKPFRREFLVA